MTLKSEVFLRACAEKQVPDSLVECFYQDPQKIWDSFDSPKEMLLLVQMFSGYKYSQRGKALISCMLELVKPSLLPDERELQTLFKTLENFCTGKVQFDSVVAALCNLDRHNWSGNYICLRAIVAYDANCVHYVSSNKDQACDIIRKHFPKIPGL